MSLKLGDSTIDYPWIYSISIFKSTSELKLETAQSVLDWF